MLPHEGHIVMGILLQAKWKMRKTSFARLVLVSLLSILLFFFVSRGYFFFIQNDANKLLLITFGGIMSLDGIDIIKVLTFSLLFVVQLALLGNEMQSDIGAAITFVFTRGGKRSRWLAGKFASILIQSITYYLTLFAVSLCCAALAGYSFGIAGIASSLGALLLTLVLTNSLLLLAVNLLTIKMRVTIVYAFALVLYTGWIMMLPLFQDNTLLLKAVPITRSMLFAHDISAMDVPIALRMPIAGTALWMLCGGVLLYVGGNIWIKRYDFLGGVD
jgi:hypothetical protein